MRSRAEAPAVARVETAKAAEVQFGRPGGGGRLTSMRVYLADLCYLNDWDTNHPVPLNVGYLAAYLTARRQGDEVRLLKDPRQLFTELSTQPPDVLALSHCKALTH